MLQVVRMGSGVQAGAGQLVEGRDEQSAKASAGAGVGEVDRARRQSCRISDSSSNIPPSIAGFFTITAPPMMRAHIARSFCQKPLAHASTLPDPLPLILVAMTTALDMQLDKPVIGVS